MKAEKIENARQLKQVMESWAFYGVNKNLAEALPENGFIIDKVCSGWLYLSDSSLAIVGWVYDYPSAIPRDKVKGIRLLLEEIKEFAENNGRPMLLAYTDKHGIIDLYKEANFIIADTNLTNMIYTGG